MTRDEINKAAAFDAMARALGYEHYTPGDAMILCTVAWELWRLRNDMAQTLGVCEDTAPDEIARLVYLSACADPSAAAPATRVKLSPVSPIDIDIKGAVYDEIVQHLELEGADALTVAQHVSDLAALRREASVALEYPGRDCGMLALVLRERFAGEGAARVQVARALAAGKASDIHQALWNHERFEGTAWWQEARAQLISLSQERTA